LLVIGLVILVVALLLLRSGQRGRVESGLPAGKVVYVDDRDWREIPAPLRSERYGLVGRPDYLMRQGRALIPVEAKPFRQADEPYESDLLQLAAYCLLIEDNFGRVPPYGLLRYRDYTFEIPYDDTLRSFLLDVLDGIREDYDADEVYRSHDEPARCQACSMWEYCGEEALC
jgi:CRISPR-associated exonuclease Cas4